MIFTQNWANPEFGYTILVLDALLLCFMQYMFWRHLRPNALHVLDGSMKSVRWFYRRTGVSALVLLAVCCFFYWFFTLFINSIWISHILSIGVGFLSAWIHGKLGFYWLNHSNLVRSVAEKNLREQQSYSNPDRIAFIKFLLYFASLVFLVFAIMRPQGEEKATTIQEKGLDVVFLLDLSHSMLATDVAPSRLHMAKSEIMRIIDGMQNDNIGLILFTGDSFVQSPLTSDKNVMRTFVRNAEPSMMPSRDTLFAPALWQAYELFEGENLSISNVLDLSPETKNTSRIIVMLTDGESHSESIKSVLESAKRLGIRIDTIGFGTYEGAELLDEKNRPLLFDNAPVITRLEDKTLKQLSAETNGLYLRYLYPGSTSRVLLDNWRLLQKKQHDQQASLSRIEFYPVWLLLSILFLAVAVIFPMSIHPMKEGGNKTGSKFLV